MNIEQEQGQGAWSGAVPAALRHFGVVFACGFLLALIRVPWLEPRLGERAAELIEMPLMLAVILWSSRRVARRWTDGVRSTRLVAGVLALTLLVAAELVLAYTLDGLGPVAYATSRDPVAGTAYALCLLVLALAPALGPGRGPSDQVLGRKPRRPGRPGRVE